jgi:hypothetical protein
MASAMKPGFTSPPQISFNDKNAEEWLEEGLFLKPSLTDFHRVVEGIFMNQQIAFAGKFGKLSVAQTGCERNGEGSIDTTQKKWEPVFLEANVKQCAFELTNTFMQSEFMPAGVDRNDPSLWAWWEAFIFERMRDAIIEDVIRQAYLGDKSITGSDLTNSGDVKFYNQVNGFWQQIFEGVTNGTIKRANTIALNSATSTAAQLDITDSEFALKIFRSLVNGSDPRLKAMPDNEKIILATTEIFDNYIEYLESRDVSPSYERIENGYNSVRFRNIRVVDFELISRYIASDFQVAGSPVKLDLPHRAILTTTDNFGVAFDALSAISSIQGSYSISDRQYYVDAAYMLDAKIFWDYLVTVAY